MRQGSPVRNTRYLRHLPMPKMTQTARFALGLLVLLPLAWGCKEVPPEERVAEMRSRYKVRLNEGGFLVREEPLEVGVPDEEAEADELGGADGQDLEEENGEEDVGKPVRQIVTLDIIVQHDNREGLPGVTVEISMVGPERNDKGNWRLWVDTAGLPKATLKQVSWDQEIPNYLKGDGFAVELRHPVPAEERGEYREFADAVGDASPEAP